MDGGINVSIPFAVVCRHNPQGSISGDRLGEAAHRLVLQTINSLPVNTQINSEAALCQNTVFHNNQVSKNVSLPVRGNVIRKIQPQSEHTRKKRKEHKSLQTKISAKPQSEFTEEKKTAHKKRKEKEKRKRNIANRRKRTINVVQPKK